MMKELSILILLFAFCINATLTGIRLDLQYVKDNVIKINDSTFLLTAYNPDSSIFYTLSLSSITPQIKDGEYISYYKNGRSNCRGNYNKNMPVGIWEYYNEQGDTVKVYDYNKVTQYLCSLDTLNISDDPVFLIVEENSKFNGSNLSGFHKYISIHLVYPDYSLKKGISEKIVVQFIIDKDGTLIQPQVLRGSNKDFIAETMRVLLNSPKWSPAKQGGKLVKQQIIIPIEFNLSSVDNQK